MTTEQDRWRAEIEEAEEREQREAPHRLTVRRGGQGELACFYDGQPWPCLAVLKMRGES